jgi:hypothetical protein
MRSRGIITLMFGAVGLLALGDLAFAGRPPADHCNPAFFIPNDGTGSGVNNVAWVRWSLPARVAPGEVVTSTVEWQFAPIGDYNPDAVVNANVFGDWAPDQEVVRLIDAQLLGQPRVERRTFTFVAPSHPGRYQMRWMYITWYHPNISFYGGRAVPPDDCSPVAWSEIAFNVTGRGR